MPKKLTAFQILSRIDPEGGLGTCWPWIGTKQNMGYGTVGINCKNILSHRWSYEHHKVKLKPSEVIRHICDNPCCCNPLHLIPGTQGENIKDAYDRNRRVHPWKITKEILYQIYELKEQKLMNKEIACRLGISRQVISKYLRFKQEVPQDWRDRLDQLLQIGK